MSNSDPIEVNKFSTMAEEWWDPTGPCKPLHDINPIRLQFIENFVKLNKQRIIDIGCGGGLLTEALAHKGAQVTGLDKSESLIAIAKQHAKDNALEIDYIAEDVECLVNKLKANFDCVCCMELLEHVPDPMALIQACSDLAKSNGWLFFSTLNRNLYAYLIAIFGAEYVLKILPKGTHQYKKFIRPSELAMAARKAGLSLKKLQGIHYNPLLARATLSEDIRVNYIVAFQKKI